MITVTTRAMRDDERAIVQRWAAAGTPKSPVGWIIGWVLGVPAMAAAAAVIARVVLIAFATITNTARMPDFSRPGPDSYWAIGLILASSLVFTLVRLLRRPHTSELYLRALQSALEAGQVEELTCTATDAAVIEQGGSDQPALFVMDVGDGQLLVVPGIDVLALVMAGNFPNTAFTLVRLPGREDIITASAGGAHLKPSRTRAPLAADETYPGAGAVLSGSLADLDTLLKTTYGSAHAETVE